VGEGGGELGKFQKFDISIAKSMVNTPLLFGINMKMSTLWRKSRYSLIDSAHNATTTLQSANPRFPFITKVFVLWAMLCWTGTVFMAGIWLGKTPEVDTHTDINRASNNSYLDNLTLLTVPF